MGVLRIGTNLASLTAQRSLTLARKETEHALKALSSGSRMVEAGDDAAGFAIGEALRAQISATRRSAGNAADAKSFIQVAEGSLNEQSNILIRLRELGVQAASDTIGDEERGFLNQEFTQLRDEFDRIAQTTRYGTQSLLRGESQSLEFQVGAYNDDSSRITYDLNANTTASSIGINGLEIADQDDARSTLEVLDEALTTISGVRANFGAIQSRLEIAENHANVHYENLQAARSRVVDADFGEEAMNLARAQILEQASLSVMAQANQDSQRVLKLLL